MGEATGTGTKNYPDGSVYEGMFYRGKPNGKGVKFGGSWKENMSSFNGSEYVDKSQLKRLKSMSNDSSFGKNNNDAFQYQGDWKDGIFHGRGILIFANKDQYMGQFKNGKPCGQGIRILKGYDFEIINTFHIGLRKKVDGSIISG